MSNAPILILQMQRMGDLVLSFPLLGWLAAAYPDRPLWVVGESQFFTPLLSLSPNATYFSYSGIPDWKNERFHAVINLSHRESAAALAASASADAHFGPYLDKDGSLRIHGDWQLYRASLTHNNFYNLFHWADLNALDLVSTAQRLRTNWPLPRVPAGPIKEARIGLFLGASEPDKHPDVDFWVEVARLLIKAGHKPVFLGGKAEAAMGKAAAAQLGMPALNVTGRFTVTALANFIGELDLLITPDTGPMHIAVWIGTSVLNLSMGPVNPWETGPFSPGHHVLRVGVDCSGCWRCTRPQVDCKRYMSAARVALAAARLPEWGAAGLSELDRRLRGHEVLRTERDAYGLFSMRSVIPNLADPAPSGAGYGEYFFHSSSKRSAVEAVQARAALARFWQAWFGALFRLFPEEELSRCRAHLFECHPQTAELLGEGIAALAHTLAGQVRTGGCGLLQDQDFWRSIPPLLRPLSGYLQMRVQNDGPGRDSLLRAVALVEKLSEEI